jgi:hypothetical protein
MDTDYESLNKDMQMITLYALRSCELAKGNISTISRIRPLKLEHPILVDIWEEVSEGISPVEQNLKQPFNKWLPQDWKYVCRSINNMWNKYHRRKAISSVGIFKLQDLPKRKRVAVDNSHEQDKEEQSLSAPSSPTGTTVNEMVSKKEYRSLLARVEALESLNISSQLQELENYTRCNLRGFVEDLRKLKNKTEKQVTKKLLEYDTSYTKSTRLSTQQYDGVMKYLNHAEEHKKLDERMEQTLDTINHQLEEFLQEKYDKESGRAQKDIKKLKDEVAKLTKLLKRKEEQGSSETEQDIDEELEVEKQIEEPLAKKNKTTVKIQSNRRAAEKKIVKRRKKN